MKQKTKKQPFYRKKLYIWIFVVLAVLLALTALAFRFSPWPGALIIRTVFNQGGSKTLQAMEANLPDYPVTVISNQQYRQHDSAAFLDVYVPEQGREDTTALPVVVWTHGGAWLSGDKKDAAPYFKRLAHEGFVVASLNYSLAPNKQYPTAIHQLNDAHEYIVTNAKRFGADADKIVLAGDSAGAQLSSQMAAIITNPAYANEVGIDPALRSSQLIGTMLFCGIYKMDGLTHPNPTLPKIVGWGNDVAVWAYTGSRDTSSPAIQEMSAYYHVSPSFPSTFISGGNGDPLTNAQSKPLADKLASLGVDVTTLFYPADHTPALPHEYQFTFNSDGENAFVKTVEFLREKTD